MLSNKKYKLTVCGHFAFREAGFADGQTIKTRIVHSAMVEKYGNEKVYACDTYKWRTKPWVLFWNCLKSAYASDNVIILMASNGIKAFVPVYYFIGMITGAKIHHVAIGGGLYGYLQKHKFTKYMISNASGIYSELRLYTEHLKGIGLNNTYTMPNFKCLDIIEKNDLKNINTSPLKLCTFSRVMPKKGIVDAINSVIKINTKFNKEVYSLDIFGQVDSEYLDKFENLQKSFPSYIKYRGVIDQEKSTSTLKDYYLLLFPTHYKTEGLPGSIIDAYSAGVPVIASRWQGFNDVIFEGITGFGYEMENQKELNNILVNLIDYSLVNTMRLNCIQEAQKYTPNNVISVLVDKLK